MHITQPDGGSTLNGDVGSAVQPCSNFHSANVEVEMVFNDDFPLDFLALLSILELSFLKFEPPILAERAIKICRK